MVTAYLHDHLALQPCYQDMSSPVSADIDGFGWYWNTGQVLNKSDKKIYYESLKSHHDFRMLSSFERKTAKRYIRDLKEISSLKEVVNNAITYAKTTIINVM